MPPDPQAEGGAATPAVPPADPARLGALLDQVARAPRAVLLLDYDGTLAPFHDEPPKAVPYPGIPEALRAILHGGRTRVVLVSGRPARDVERLLGLGQPVEIWGAHGLEHLDARGQLRPPELPEQVEAGLARARTWTERRGIAHRREDKPGCVAIHLRTAGPEERSTLEREIRETLGPLATEHGLRLDPFDGGLELRATGASKAHAVQAILAEERLGVPVAYLGDDRTDEEAFEALGSRGLSVLVRPEPRASLAPVWIRPPEALLDFLGAWARLTSRPLEAPE